MIQSESRLVVADNTWAKEVLCIKVLWGSHRRYASIWDKIVVVVKKLIQTGLSKRKLYKKLLLLELLKKLEELMDLILDSMIMLV